MKSKDIVSKKTNNDKTIALTNENLLHMLSTMIIIRQFETSAAELFSSGEIRGTAHSCVGQEAIAVAACGALAKDDFILTHHRGHGQTIAKGADIKLMMAELMGKENGYCRGLGGSMHIADFDCKVLGANGIVGASMGLGVGAALAEKTKSSNAVGIAFFGDGAAGEGIFHEALNLASIWNLPIVFFCENNQYGISTRMEDVIAGKGIARRAEAYNLPGQQIDGNDVFPIYETVADAVKRARDGCGPSLIEAMTYRWGDHSMRANLPRYRTEDEVNEWRDRDPIMRLLKHLIDIGKCDRAMYKKMCDQAIEKIGDAINWSRKQKILKYDTAINIVYAPPKVEGFEPSPGNRNISYAEAITEGIMQEMERDTSVILIGEDVGKIGGIFGLTRGLQEKFGSERVRDTPIAENVLSNCGVGAAMMGLRPIVEVQILDFITLMMDGIINQAAKARFMMGGKTKIPIVFRGPQGAGISLAAQHSQSLESLFTHIPGLEVYIPSNAYDAKGLIVAAIRSDNPVIFIENKLLYMISESRPVPEECYAIQPGKARIVREGTDCTVIALLSMVDQAMQAATKLEKKGISIEVIDPRTVKPLDMDQIIKSVKKTNRAVIVHESARFCGIGSEIASNIMEQAFDWLDAPVARVTAPNMPVPYSAKLEQKYIPNADDITKSVKEVYYYAR